jgi:hypothetical protein
LEVKAISNDWLREQPNAALIALQAAEDPSLISEVTIRVTVLKTAQANANPSFQ